jgi:hypothetical protein
MRLSCKKLVVSFVGALLLAAASLTGVSAQEKPLLVVSGKIAQATAQFDRAGLEALGMVSVVTNTPWYKDPVNFEGVPLAKLMAAVGAKGERLSVVALNDYSAEVPMEDVNKYNVILALKRNGEYMPVRDKGPLFIIYPFDSDPDLKNQKFYSRSVWQVARIEVR